MIMCRTLPGKQKLHQTVQICTKCMLGKSCMVAISFSGNKPKQSHVFPQFHLFFITQSFSRSQGGKTTCNSDKKKTVPQLLDNTQSFQAKVEENDKEPVSTMAVQSHSMSLQANCSHCSFIHMSKMPVLHREPVVGSAGLVTKYFHLTYYLHAHRHPGHICQTKLSPCWWMLS